MSFQHAAPPDLTIAVVGATGAVGQEIVQVLAAWGVQSAQVGLFASERSAGIQVMTPWGERAVQAFDRAAVAAYDVVLLAVSGAFSQDIAPDLAAHGGVVIDTSSAFRYDPHVPLVVPEINGKAAVQASLIASPNCTTTLLVMVLWPLAVAFGLKKVLVSTYQAASGAGTAGMCELEEQTQAWFATNQAETGQAETGQAETGIFGHPLPFNIIPHIDTFQGNGYTREEMKVCWETRKVMDMPDLAVSCTAVRVPVRRAHAESVVIETAQPVTVSAAREVLSRAPGVCLVDDPEARAYPMPLTASGRMDVEVGRLRHSLVFGAYGLEFFLCGDQLLKGAALNAVQIIDRLVGQRVLRKSRVLS